MDAIQPAWKIISLLLGLGLFLGVGILALSFGDEPVWSIGKAMGAFIACWVLLNYLGALLGMIAEKPAEDISEEYADVDIDDTGNERGT
ncbi:MAG: hypothetical protein NT018_10615 [Armatimonadetes bacterium]|nr:hypothetical protein [Armatimonadota bacterium]